METYGLAVYSSSGVSILNNSNTVNSLFVEKLVVNTAGTGGTFTRTYPNIPNGSYLVVQQTGQSFHSYTIGTNGSGQATISFTAYSAGVAADSTFLIFTKYVVEPDYGFSFINSSGVKIASSEYATPEYLGQVSSFSYAGSVTSGSYIGYIFIGNISVAQHNYMLAWALPLNTSANIWYQVDSYVYSNMSASATFTVWALNTVTNFPLPVAIVYKVPPLHNGVSFSGTTSGIQLFDSNGSLTFDSSFIPLNIFSIYTDVSYTATGGNALGSWGVNTNNYTGVSFTPAIVFPDSYISAGYGSGLYRLAYAASTSGSTYSLKYTAAGANGTSSTYSFIGTTFSNLSITMVDTSQQGGTPTFGSYTVPYTPTQRVFTSGTNTFTVPTGCTSLNVLLVGGGGNGGTSTYTSGTTGGGGAGSGGQVLNYTAYSVTAGQTITCTVGTAGGSTIISGGNSGTITANGGSAGGNIATAGSSGASASALQNGVNTDPTTSYGAGSNSTTGAGGAGGSGGAGSAASSGTAGGTGGIGVSVTINGTTYNVGGGGGGGSAGSGGTASYGGGAGGNLMNIGANATANTGGGGGGAGGRLVSGGNSGGSGASGIIVCYG